MKFSSLRLDNRRRTYVRLIGQIRHALNQALADESHARNLTRADIARLLGKNKAFVTRTLNGTSNMTIETLADFAFALDRSVKVELLPRSLAHGSNHMQTPGSTTNTTAPAVSDPDKSLSAFAV